MKKTSKIVLILLMLIVMLTISTSVFAQDPNKYIGNRKDLNKLESLGQRIVGIIQIIGSVASVAVLIVLGIKYMMGSTEEKAEYKKTMIPYIIGAILIFAATNIAKVIFDFADKVTT